MERPNQNQFNARKYHLTYPCFKFSKFVLTKHLKIVINKLYVPIIKLTRQTMKITCSLSKDSFQKFFFQICWPDYKLILIRIKERRIFAFDDVNLIFTCGCQKSNFPICQWQFDFIPSLIKLVLWCWNAYRDICVTIFWAFSAKFPN